MGYIYVITNTVNLKCYVGQSGSNPVGVGGRVTLHLKCRGSKEMIDDVLKYGKEVFDTEIIDYPGISEKALNSLEKYYIETKDCVKPNGYNVLGGLSGGSAKKSSDKNIPERWVSETHTICFETHELTPRVKKVKKITSDEQMRIMKVMKNDPLNKFIVNKLYNSK